MDIRAFIESQKLLISSERRKFEKQKSQEECSSSSQPIISDHLVETSEQDCHNSVRESVDSLPVLSRNASGIIIDRNEREESAVKPFSPHQLSGCQQSLEGSQYHEYSKNEKENVSLSIQEDREKKIRFLQDKLAIAPFWDRFGNSKSSRPQADGNMVRVGEFSPANPILQAPGKAHLGLGEYEERRRQLLEHKKQEYKEYLSQNRNHLHKTNHFHQSAARVNDVSVVPRIFLGQTAPISNSNNNGDFVDVATQTDLWLMQPTVANSESAISVVPSNVNGFISTDGPSLLNASMESPLPSLSPRVPRAHISQTTEQLPDARLRQIQLQEELRQQIEEKKKLEAERRERDRLEEEALQRRVAEQQARLHAEYEKEEQLRIEREKLKQQQMEDFQRRQEELKVEAEQLKQEKRQRKLDAVVLNGPKESSSGIRMHNAHVVPHTEPTSISILKNNSPPPRSPRHAISPAPADLLAPSPSRLPEQLPQPPPPLSPRALIKVLEGPTYPSTSRNLNDTLPIPLMPVAHTYAPTGYPLRSPRRSPLPSVRHTHKPANQHQSDAMRSLEDRWKIPAVQKNQCVRERVDTNPGDARSVLTQLGTFRRQLQMEHMRMQEKVRESSQQQQYQEHHFQRDSH